MAYIHSHFDGVPERRRRKKTARERREQRVRAITRAFQTVASALQNVADHRGGKLMQLGVHWHGHVLSPDASSLPMPRFRGGYIAAAAAAAEAADKPGGRVARLPSGDESLQGEGSEESNCNNDASLASGDDDIDSQLHQSSSSEATDSESADDDDVARRMVEADPEQQIFFRQIFRPEVLREDVGGSDVERCKFCIGDVIRPVKRLADLKAYGCGEICQVVGLDDEEDPIVSYYHPSGRITEECTKRYAEHFEYAGSAALFEANPGVPHSTWMSVLNTNYRH